jgi:hypothetical protein
MPKSKNKSQKEDDSDWETVTKQRQAHQDRERDRHRSRSPPRSGKTQPEVKESTQTRADSLGGKRPLDTDSETEGKVDPKRTPTRKSPTKTTKTTSSSATSQVPTSSKKSEQSDVPQKIQKIPNVSTNAKPNPSKSSTTSHATPTSISWADEELETNRPSYAQAAKRTPQEFKKPLPIPEWKELELRIFKTSFRQVPISHKEFSNLRAKLYDYVLQHLKTHPGTTTTRYTAASFNQWSAALQCGIWECNNKEALAWYKEAIANITNKEFRAWTRYEKSTQLIKIFPHESFSHYSAKLFLESVHYYHLDLNINAWKVLHEYRQKRGNRVLVVEVPVQLLDLAKTKATHDSGQWRLQGMAMPMRFAMATPNDLLKNNPEPETTNLSELSSTPVRPPTPRTPVTTKPATPKVAQPGPTTPLTSAMSGFSLASPFRQNPPATNLAPVQNQGEYYTMYDPQTQSWVPLANPPFLPQTYYPQPFNQPYQVMSPAYQPAPLPYPQLQPVQQNPPPPPPQHQPALTPDQPSFTPEEIEEALKDDNAEPEHTNFSDSDQELLNEDEELLNDTNAATVTPKGNATNANHQH